jgi:hypothetical protein
MQCLLLIISVLFLPAVYAVVTLEVGSTAGVLVPTNVTWTREDGDPTIFDLRFVSGNADVGFAATIEAPNGELSGTIPVTFMTQGPFVLKAVDFDRHGDQVIAASSHIDVGANPPSPSLPPSSQTVIALPTTSSTVTATTSGASGPTGTPSALTSTITSASSTSTLTHAGSTKAPTSPRRNPQLTLRLSLGAF